jgi:hypothetical protein
MDDRRRLERRHILFYSRVFDRQSGMFVGYLGNMTVAGAMVISEKPFDTNVEHLLRIDLPEDIYPQPVLNLQAYAVYCQPDIDPHFYNTGFRLLNVTREEVAIIEQIIQDYGFHD